LQSSKKKVLKAAKGVNAPIDSLLNHTNLAPDIIDQLMAGRQPRRLTLMWFQRNPLPLDWQAQRAVFARP
jgi:hypothetical protein